MLHSLQGCTNSHSSRRSSRSCQRRFLYHMGEPLRFGHATYADHGERGRCVSHGRRGSPSHLPGHSTEGWDSTFPIFPHWWWVPCFQGRPTQPRWDLPSGSLLDIIDSIKRMKRLNVSSLVPLQGPAIRGR